MGRNEGHVKLNQSCGLWFDLQLDSRGGVLGPHGLKIIGYKGPRAHGPKHGFGGFGWHRGEDTSGCRP